MFLGKLGDFVALIEFNLSKFSWLKENCNTIVVTIKCSVLWQVWAGLAAMLKTLFISFLSLTFLNKLAIFGTLFK